MNENTFQSIVSKCKTFHDFYRQVCILNNDLKGKYFEQFAEHYFCLQSVYPVKNYYPIKTIPRPILQRFALPNEDIGVDAMMELETGEWLTVQVKFKTSVTQATSYKELSTWLATTFISAPRDIRRGVLFTNAEVVTDRLKYATNIIRITGSELKHQADEDFFRKIVQRETERLQPKKPSPPPSVQDSALREVKRQNNLNNLDRFKFSPKDI